MNLYPSKKYIFEVQKLLKKNSLYKPKLEKALFLLNLNCRHPSLRLHRLSGTDNYSVSVDRSIRIIMHIEGENIYLLRIGTHNEVY